MTTKPTTTATARRTAKNIMFILTNNKFARASRYFVHVLSCKSVAADRSVDQITTAKKLTILFGATSGKELPSAAER